MGSVVPFPTPTSWEPYVTEQMVAAHFCVSGRTVRRYVQAGMPFRRLGGRKRFRLSECEAWLAQRGRAA